jgi:hypothetical protein
VLGKVRSMLARLGEDPTRLFFTFGNLGYRRVYDSLSILNFVRQIRDHVINSG